MHETLAIVCLAFIAYAYAGYPLVLWGLTRGKPEKEWPSDVSPEVDVIIAAHNEEATIKETIDSLLASHYPSERLKIWVVSDASTDDTDTIVKTYPAERVRLLRQDPRAGKLSAQDYATRHAQSAILIYADASSCFQPETIQLLVRHFYDPGVGSVVGRKQIRRAGIASSGEGAYWRYEGTLRYWESRLGSSWVGVEGGLYAIRKSLASFDFPPDYAADYSVCCRVFEKGYRNHYEPLAIILEGAAPDMKVELARKIRVIVRGIRAFFGFGYLLRPLRHPMFFFQNVSHRLLRWTVPFELILLAFATSHSGPLWMKILFYAQLFFYSAALIGIGVHAKQGMRYLKIPAYFLTTNFAALLSWGLCMRKYATWEPTLRTSTRQRQTTETPRGGYSKSQ